MQQKIALEHCCRVEHAEVNRACVRLPVSGKKPEIYVEIFRLIGHATADTAFAWKFPLVQKERNKPSKIIIYLKREKINSPMEAVYDWAKDIFIQLP